MTPLDRHIREMMLSYPALYATRNQALHCLFCKNGNGLTWRGGRIIDPHARPFVEALARAAYFDGTEKHPLTTREKLERARRQFHLDTLDLRVITPDRDLRLDAMLLLRSYHRHGWLAMNVPEDAEESYRKGALEALEDVAATLRGALIRGHPTLLEIIAQIDALDPGRAALTEIILQEAERENLGEGQEPVILGPIERGAAAYCIEIENTDDFIALCRADDDLHSPLHPTLLDRLDGDHLKGLREIEGVSRIEYNGHFGSAVHYTVDAEDDLPDTHDKIRRIIADQVRRARAWVAAQTEKETS